jgi:hypothetical protein
MNYRRLSLVGSVGSFVCSCLVSCSSNDNVMIVGPSGGASSTGTGGSGIGGASVTNTGGANATGGATSAVQGGTTSTGGQSATGGGTNSLGGAATGGNANGGQSVGGAATGGAAIGGASATGGSSAIGAGGTAVGGAATGGTANGGTATGGAPAAGATSNPVTPTMVSATDYRLALTACNVVMDVNPQIGARVASLTYNGTNVMMPYACTGAYSGTAACNGSGSTFWTSPQSGWDGNTSTTGDWPPVAEVDGNAYAPSITGTHLVATGSANASLGANITKDFSADAGSCWITLLYKINATKAISAAPWEITRVPRGGIALFPVGDSAKLVPGPLASYTTTTTTTTPNIAWFNDTAKTATNVSGSKLVADGASGWLAYALNGVLFIKKFADVQPASFASGEGDVEIYADLSGFLELEVQGAYSPIASGASTPWTVQWRVVAIPSTVTVSAGSASLLTFVQEQVAM